MKRCGLILFLLAHLVSCQGETEEIDAGYRGEARTNPLLAAERFSTQMGLEAQSYGIYPGRPPTDTLLIATLASVAYEGGLSDELRSWIQTGGQLFLLLPSTDDEDGDKSNPFGDSVSEVKEESAQRGEQWLRWLGVEVSTDELSEAHFLAANGASFEIVPAKSPALHDTTGQAVAPIVGTHEAALLLTYGKGQGSVSVFSSANWIHSNHIAEGDNAAFLWHLLSESERERVWFIYGARPSLRSLIWSRAWMVCVSVLGLIAVWLWRSALRFGPLQMDPPPGRRDFGEHVSASGLFLWRQQRADVLLGAARKRFERRLASVAPELARLEQPLIAEAVAQRTGLETQRCLEALNWSPSNDPSTFMRTLRDLRRMQNLL